MNMNKNATSDIPAPLNCLVIRGHIYAVMDASLLPLCNVCNHCAFKGTDCYDDLSFSCHSDSRPDGRDVYFVFYV